MSSSHSHPTADTLAAEPALGQLFDQRYEIVETMGEGGVGVVYRAERVKLGLPVAIKLLRHQSAADQEIRLRFEREARAMAALAHPNIVSVTDFGVWQGRPYLVMELLEGQTLRDRLREGLMPIAEAMHVMEQFLRGLAYAHSVGLVHRDLKPENLFLQQLPGQLPHVKILDFGFAKLADEQTPQHVRDLTRSGMVFGTPAYMSPEQAMGDTMDTRTDVYAAGVILFEALTGKRPFEGDFAEVRRLKVSEPAPPLTAMCPTLRPSPPLVDLVNKALAGDRKARFEDAAALLDALKALPKPPATRGGKARGRALLSRIPPLLRDTRRAVPALVVALGVLLVVGYLGVRGPSTAAEAPAPAPTKPTSAHKPGADEPDEDESTARERPQKPTADEAGRAPREEVEEMVIRLDELPAEAHSAAVERPPPGNPWNRPALPGRVRYARRRALRGLEVSTRDRKAALKFARDNRDDPRGSLILAYIYANQDWLSDAIERYRLAYRIDAAARGDRRMKRDLIRFVTHPKLGEAATRAVREIYGAEAVAGIERALQYERLTAAERDALAALHDELAGR